MDGTALGTAATLATLAVPLVSLLKLDHWPRRVKALVSVLISAIIAVVAGVVDGNVKSPKDFLTYVGTAYAVGQGVYHILFKDTPLDQTLTEVQLVG